MNPLVSVSWLSEHLQDKNLILLDASIPKVTESQDDNKPKNSIPGARFFDIKGAFSNMDSPFPNTVPEEAQFEKECQRLGINTNSKIIVFDQKGTYSSPRAWWLFKVMGHKDVAVLDGGLPAWIKEGLPTKSLPANKSLNGNFSASLETSCVISYQDVLNNVEQKSFTILDARSKGRFDGTASEPRKNLQSGHIPNSINLPYTNVLENGKFKSKNALIEVFTSINIPQTPLVFSCGSGITACIIMLAYEIAFESSRNLFDGSWTEWAIRQELVKDG